MALLITLTLLLFGLLPSVFAQGGVVQVWPNDTHLKYSGEGGNDGVSWGNPGLNPTVYNNQTCEGGVRATYNQNASVSLEFSGTSLIVWLLADHLGANASIYLDSNIVSQENTFNATTDYYLCTMIAIQASDLQATIHNVTIVKDSGPQSILYLHGFQFTPSAIVLPSSSPSSGAAITGTTTTTAATQTGSSAPETASSKTGPIVGGVIGGVIILILIAAAVIFLILRRRRGHHPRALDMTAHPIDLPNVPQSPTFAKTTRPTPFVYQPEPTTERPSFETAQASSSSPIPRPPMTVSEKMRLASTRTPSQTPPSAATVARADELAGGQDISSDQLNLVRTLVDRNVPGQAISRVVEMMVAGSPIPNPIEGSDIRHSPPPAGPPPQYSAAPRRP